MGVEWVRFEIKGGGCNLDATFDVEARPSIVDDEFVDHGGTTAPAHETSHLNAYPDEQEAADDRTAGKTYAREIFRRFGEDSHENHQSQRKQQCELGARDPGPRLAKRGNRIGAIVKRNEQENGYQNSSAQ